MKRKNLIGQKFGKLTVISQSESKNGRRFWECKCDCGKTCLVSSINLIRGDTKSCGCLAVENGKKVSIHMKEARKESYVAHTDILLISDPQKKNSRNTSGCRGVSWDSSVNMWKAYINFQGKRYYLGGFKDIEPAIDARRAAEKEIYGNFLEWYKDNFKDGRD